MRKIRIRVRQKKSARDLPLPNYATCGSSGMDLYADVEGEVVLHLDQIKLISTGIYVSIPEGYEAEIRPRSGLALKHGITILNTPGTIDSDFRGLVSLIVINLGREPFVIKRGMRLAQMVIKEVIRAELELVDGLDKTVRSIGGFGHTGM